MGTGTIEWIHGKFQGGEMTALEAMTEAIERGLDLLDIDVDTEEAMKIARAAILALAECELPEAAIIEGVAMVLLGRTLDASQRVVARDTFRAMLRAIASPQRQDEKPIGATASPRGTEAE